MSTDRRLLELLRSVRAGSQVSGHITRNRAPFPLLPAEGRFHIIAPDLALTLLRSRTTNPDFTWSETIDGALEPGAPRTIVIANRWESERAMLARLRAAGTEAFGLLSDLLPREIIDAPRPWEAGGVAPTPEEPTRRYAIVCQARSGSTYLCQLLSDAGFGRPTEDIHAQASWAGQLGMPVVEILRRVSAWRSASDIFGTKILVTHFSGTTNWSFERARATVQALKDRGYVIFELVRNPVDLAVSTALASKLDIWNAGEEHLDYIRSRQMEARVSDHRLLLHLHAGIAHAAYSQRVLGTPPERTFSYAKLISDPAGVVRAIAGALGGPAEPFVAPAQTARLGENNPAYEQLRRRTLELIRAEGMKGLPLIIHYGVRLTRLSPEELSTWPEFSTLLNKVIAAANRVLAHR